MLPEKPTEDDLKKLALLSERLREISPLMVAFSGGVDSSFLALVAHKEVGLKSRAVTAVSPLPKTTNASCSSNAGRE